MIKRINSIDYAYSKIILQSRQDNIIYEGFFGNLINGAKAGLKKVKDFAVNAVSSIGKWVKGLWNLIKIGVSMLTSAVSGKYKSNPSSYAKDSSQLQQNLYIVLPFFKKPMSVLDKAGKQTHDAQFKQLKVSLKGKHGEQTNIDYKSKKVATKLWSRAKQPFIASVKGTESEAESMGAQFKKQQNAQQAKSADSQKQTTDKDKKQQSDTTSGQLTTQDIRIINQQNCRYVHQLHDLIIDWVYKGITPKVIMQAIDNQYSSAPQGNLILQNKCLSFKTNSGNLICQEYNLITKDTIIYQSDCAFKGKHLIYQQTEGKYKKFNNIITQEDQQQYNTIISEQIDLFQIISIISILLTVVGLITAIKHILIAPLTAATAGAAGVAAQGTKPVQAAGGSVAGNATVVGSQQVTTQAVSQTGQTVAKQSMKHTLKNVIHTVKAARS